YEARPAACRYELAAFLGALGKAGGGRKAEGRRGEDNGEPPAGTRFASRIIPEASGRAPSRCRRQEAAPATDAGGSPRPASVRLAGPLCNGAETGEQTSCSPALTTDKENPMKRMPKWSLVLLCFALLLIFAGPALADEATGKIKSVDAGKGTLVVTVDGKDYTFTAEASVAINTLKPGDEV